MNCDDFDFNFMIKLYFLHLYNKILFNCLISRESIAGVLFYYFVSLVHIESYPYCCRVGLYLRYLRFQFWDRFDPSRSIPVTFRLFVCWIRTVFMYHAHVYISRLGDLVDVCKICWSLFSSLCPIFMALYILRRMLDIPIQHFIQ